MPESTPLLSVVIPAHNEARSITRLLSALAPPESANEPPIEVVVVCNGCTDGTADVARAHGRAVVVVESPIPSKAEALVTGDAHATAYPRIYVDADVEIDDRSVRAIADALGGPILAAGPRRELDMTRVPWLVRWYYDVWERLPAVQDGLFGRGVVALTEAGHDRVRRLPPMMSDDLVMSEAFDRSETAVVDGAVVRVQPPRTLSDLVTRRIRVVTGNAQADGAGLRSAAARTSPRDIARIVRATPAMAPKVVVFTVVTVVTRLAAARAIRRGDFSTWRRDESSRT